jgi:O-antigen/teichoic acid export membrane protein
MEDNKKSYQSIIKATSLFGGVQVFNIIIQIIRSKIIAVLLGPAGMGIAGLFLVATNFIGGLTNFGLGTSGIRDVAEASKTDDLYKINKIVTVLRKIVWFTGFLGAIVTMLLSRYLSQLTFGNDEYTLAFIWLSVTLLFNQLTVGELVVLQGLRKLQYLAKANLLGNFLGLLITVPLYYFYRIDAIVPAIIVTSLVNLFFSRYFSKKLKIRSVELNFRKTFYEGKDMMKLGFFISMSGIITLGVSYAVRIFISNIGGVEEVGLYTAGFAIINTYVGLIFTAMGTDYYPRLAAVSSDNDECTKIINQQAEIALLIISPIILVFLVYIRIFILLIYSTKFITIDLMIYWAALGMIFKTIGWAIGFLILAKGNNKIFFWNELIFNIQMLILNLCGYYFFGLEGLGISFMVSFFIYLIQVYSISKIKYMFKLSFEVKKIFIIQFFLAFFCLGIVLTMEGNIIFFWGTILIIFSTLFSIKELDRRIGIIAMAKSFLKKKA